MQCNDCRVQLVSWYDNEWGYSNRVRSIFVVQQLRINLHCSFINVVCGAACCT